MFKLIPLRVIKHGGPLGKSQTGVEIQPCLTQVQKGISPIFHEDPTFTFFSLQKPSQKKIFQEHIPRKHSHDDYWMIPSKYIIDKSGIPMRSLVKSPIFGWKQLWITGCEAQEFLLFLWHRSSMEGASERDGHDGCLSALRQAWEALIGGEWQGGIGMMGWTVGAGFGDAEVGVFPTFWDNDNWCLDWQPYRWRMVEGSIFGWSMWDEKEHATTASRLWTRATQCCWFNFRLWICSTPWQSKHECRIITDYHKWWSFHRQLYH